MSSIKYAQKTEEELRQILANYQNQYTTGFGTEPNAHGLIQKLNELAARKNEDLFNQCFGHLNSRNIADCVSLLQAQMKEQIQFNTLQTEEPKTQGPKAKNKKGY